MTTLSATQIDLAKTCLRQWAFRYLTDLPKPPKNPSMELGIKLHKVAEDYLKSGKAPIPDTLEGEIFMKGMEHLPAPKVGVVEGDRKIEIGGVWYRLIIDCTVRGDSLPNWGYGSIPVALDHKTSSNPKKYGLIPDTFLDNTQAIIYAYWLLAVNHTHQVGLRWVYYKTKGRALSYPVDKLVTSDQIFSSFKELIEPVANELVELYNTRPDPNTIRCSPTECYKHNRACHYQQCCKISAEERSLALSKKYLNKGGPEMAVPSIKEKMAMQQAQQGQIGAVQQTDGINPPVPGRTLPPQPQVPQGLPPQPQASLTQPQVPQGLPPQPPASLTQPQVPQGLPPQPQVPQVPVQTVQTQPPRDEMMRQASVGNDPSLQALVRVIRDALNTYLGE